MQPLEPKVWPDTARLDAHGVLEVGGLDVQSLARDYGTPLFVLDRADVERRLAEYSAAFADSPLEVHLHYASKAFASADFLRWVDAAGFGVDVASGGELALALAAGVPGERIVMHGNNKSTSELQRAIAAGVSAIVIDSFDEIDRLERLVRDLAHRVDVMIRLTLGVEAHTHEFIATAHEDQKFGLSVASGAAEEAVKQVLEVPNLRLTGFHSHIGSQMFDPKGFELAAVRALEFCGHLRDHLGYVADELDLGGGLGIAYLPGDDPLPIADMASALSAVVVRSCERLALPLPTLSLEPGRAIVGTSTITLYEVGTVKPVALDGGEQRLYVSVDGGMSDNLRTSLYGAEYTARVVNRSTLGVPVQARVVGKHCESGDIVVRDVELPADIGPGDLLAVASSGAYHRSMASNYNLVPRPGVVAVRDGIAQVLIRRETESDLLRLDAGL